MAVADLNTINNATTVAVNAAAITTLTGAAVDIKTAYDDSNVNSQSGITGLNDEDIYLTDTTLDPELLNEIDGYNGNSSGRVYVNDLTALNGLWHIHIMFIIVTKFLD